MYKMWKRFANSAYIFGKDERSKDFLKKGPECKILSETLREKRMYGTRASSLLYDRQLGTVTPSPASRSSAEGSFVFPREMNAVTVNQNTNYTGRRKSKKAPHTETERKN